MSSALHQILIIFICILVGFVCRKLKVLTEEGTSTISNIVVKVILPFVRKISARLACTSTYTAFNSAAIPAISSSIKRSGRRTYFALKKFLAAAIPRAQARYVFPQPVAPSRITL